jgi:hypothetical protein
MMVTTRQWEEVQSKLETQIKIKNDLIVHLLVIRLNLSILYSIFVLIFTFEDA